MAFDRNSSSREDSCLCSYYSPHCAVQVCVIQMELQDVATPVFVASTKQQMLGLKGIGTGAT